LRSERLHAAEDDYRADRRDWKIAGNREQGIENFLDKYDA
jgi:hypothetical protein